MSNRLADATSPYLLQHQDNPVDWWPWGEEAFAEARRRDLPVLLSVGYAACHWCHVMAHESFEDEATAAVMNAHFVNVKVDREERPDVDAVYMAAVQAMTGHGGWPMTVFLTPAAEPFYAGTYFPPEPRHGMPSFRQLLASVAAAWRDRRDAVEAGGADVVRRLAELTAVGGTAQPLTARALDRAAASLARGYDATRGGFGGAPKFPPSMVLEFLLRHHARTGDADALAMVEGSCAAMARGGMYDQLAGGFARYSVDADWVVPHFEKMLYDNALLARVYLHWWRATGSPLGRRVAEETCDFLLRDLATPEGGFASALDADTPVDGRGVEGATYVWTPGQLADVLGPADGAWAADLLAVTERGSFEHGTSTLQLRRDPDDPARWAQVRARLAAARAERPQPARDDKVVTAWNGLAVAALAECGALLDRPDLVAAARGCAELLLATHRVDGRLRRVSRDGVAGPHAGVLEDYGDLAEGLLALYGVTGETRWYAAADELLDVVLARFGDGRGGFYDTADDAEVLVRRPQDPTDNATPSGMAAAAGALVSYAALAGSGWHRAAAEAALATVTRLADGHARFVGWAAAVGEALLAGPVEVAVVGPPDDPARAALHRVALAATSPGAVVAVGEPVGEPAGEPGGEPVGEPGGPPGVPLLADRPLVDGRPAGYVCRGFVCERPVTDPAALAAAVQSLLPR